MITITEGLTHYQVLQRDAHNQAAARLTGTCARGDSGAVEARLLRSAFPVAGWDWKPVGEAKGGRWTADLVGLPVGGPYRVEIRSAGKADVTALHEILVGDLWMLAGQSNMEGVGDLVDVEPPSPLVHNFDMADNWVLAEEPLHWLCDSPDPVHTDQKEPQKMQNARAVHASRTKGAGLGLPFAKEMVRRTGVSVGLLSCAHGGTSMEQWNPAYRDQGGNSLYGSMYRRFKLAGGQVKGVLWYQGESDAFDAESAKAYAKKFRDFIAAVRRDFGDPNLPFYFVQIGRFTPPPSWGKPDPSHWNAVQEVQRTLPKDVPNTAVVAAIDLEIDDLIHIGTQGLKRLGRRLANVACHELFGDRSVTTGPKLRGVTREGDRLRVSFEDVNGGFSETPRISGFVLRDASGAELHLIHKVTVDRQKSSDLLLHLAEAPPKGAQLWYGVGYDPYCNLVDARDMAVPLLGPIPVNV